MKASLNGNVLFMDTTSQKDLKFVSLVKMFQDKNCKF